MQGILIVDKPAGWTSFDVIAKLRGVLETRKLGHSGTLDPMATGVLPVFAGPSTKAADLQPDHTKAYRARVRLGVATDTGDITGEVTSTGPVQADEEAARRVLESFVGDRMQLPPMYSAVKINGVPLYKAARAGKTVERKPRPITIHSIELVGKGGENEYDIQVSCSKGTYIRVLAEEIGQALGCPATLAALRRTRAGVWNESCAHTLEEILAAKEQGGLAAVQALLLDTETAFSPLPLLEVDQKARFRLENGAPVFGLSGEAGRYRLRCEGQFIGLGQLEDRVLRAEKLFVERG